MTASNLAIVFGPTLLNSPDEEAIVKDMDASHKLIKTLVQRHEELFDQPPPQVGGAGRGGRDECSELILSVYMQIQSIITDCWAFWPLRYSSTAYKNCTQ